jgi:hypothetical protein
MYGIGNARYFVLAQSSVSSVCVIQIDLYDAVVSRPELSAVNVSR